MKPLPSVISGEEIVLILCRGGDNSEHLEGWRWDL